MRKTLLLLLVFGFFVCFSASAWTMYQHTDSFGDYTGEHYLSEGGIHFEYYKGSRLKVSFNSSEYGYYRADYYTIELKEMDGTVHSFRNGEPAFYGNKAEEILDIILRNDTTKVYVFYSFGYGYSFRFDVKNTGLTNGMNQLRALVGLPSLEEENAIKAQEKAAKEAAEIEAEEKRKAFSTSSSISLAVGYETQMMPPETTDENASIMNGLVSVRFTKLIFKNGFVGGSVDGSFGGLGKEIGLSAEFGMGFKFLQFGLRIPVRFNIDNSSFGIIMPQVFLEGFLPFKKGGLVLGVLVGVVPENPNARAGLYLGYSLKSKEGLFGNWYYK